MELKSNSKWQFVYPQRPVQYRQNLGSKSQLVTNQGEKYSFLHKLLHQNLGKIATINTLWLCSHGLESRSERCFGSRSKTLLGSWFELHAFTCIVNAFPITIRICALRGNNLLLLCSPRLRARWLTHALMHGLSVHFKNAHARITFRKSFAFTCPRIRLSRRITIQNALFFAFQNEFQKPDLKWLCVHMG